MNTSEAPATPADIKYIAASILAGIYKDVKKATALRGLSWGYDHLDSFTHGLQPGQMVVIGGRPGCSDRLDFALNIIERATSGVEPVGVCIFTINNDADRVMQRMSASASKVKIGPAPIESELNRFKAALERLAKCPIYIVDNTSLTLTQLTTTAKNLLARSDIRLVVIDDIQRLAAVSSGHSESRECSIRNISNGLRALAKELMVPIIALSQLSRDFEYEDRRPGLYSLEGSSAIEEDADVVALLTDISGSNPCYDAGQPTHATLHLLKNRNGLLADLRLDCFSHFCRYDEPASEEAASSY